MTMAMAPSPSPSPGRASAAGAAAAAAANASATLKAAHVWEVSAPLPLTPSGKGQRFLPANLGVFLPAHLFAHRRRRISVEVHRSESPFGSTAVRGGSSGAAASRGGTAVATTASSTDDSDPRLLGEAEICYVRVLERKAANPKEAVLDPLAHKIKERVEGKKIRKGTVNFFTGTMRSNRGGGGGGDSDDDSTSDLSFMRSFREPTARAWEEGEEGEGDDEDEAFDGWVPKYKVALRMFRVVDRKKRSVLAAFEAKGRSAHREFVFDDESDAADFCAIVDKNRALLEERTKARLKTALAGIQLKKDEELTFLLDICSGTDLPQGDLTGESDPYVVVRFQGKRIHKTAYVSDNANPIWTLRKGALFVWKVDALDLFQSEEGLVFEVKDYDAIGSDESLGAFGVTPRTLYRWDGERREFALKPLLGERDFGRGKVSLRVRRATEHDVEFMRKYEESLARKNNLIALPNVQTGAAQKMKTMMAVHSKKEKEGPDKGKTIYLVRPGPDPKRKEETAWLTSEKIQEESMRLSYEWTDIGSGSLGKIFVEILECDGLPNLDSKILGDKTDTFVSLVYEDCFARTDTVSDCLSPRWMPWTKRAFIFNMMHTSSQLFLAVFDEDCGMLNSHDLIGRVSIDISNFRPDTVYTLHYNLFPTAKCGPREANSGTIKIRLRMELEDERTLVLSTLQWPGSVYVNVEAKKDYEVIRQTVEGNVDTRGFSLGTINSFSDELMSYLTLYYALLDCSKTVLLWRGTLIIYLPMPSFSADLIKWVGINFPVHSLVTFFSLVSLVENPNLLPSFYFGCIGWLLVVAGERRAYNNPNPWMRSKSFVHFLSSLLLGKSILGPQAIKAHETVAGMEVENFWEKRVRLGEERAKKRAEEYAREQEQYLKELEEIGDVNGDLAAEKLDPGLKLFPQYLDVKTYLFPLQQYLSVACTWLRVLKNILVWEESYISFWVAFGSFVISVVVFFIPWGFVLKWSLRLIVWIFVGPWMKLADVYYFSRLNEETDEQRRLRLSRLERERRKIVEKRKLEAQIAREHASKLRDFKQYMFGENICRVNILKKDRYYDFPLPASNSEIYIPKSKSLGELAMQEAGYCRTRVDGQHLVGEMIPKIYESRISEAPTGRPTKNAGLLEKGSPAAFYDGDDSYVSAAIHCISIIVGAGAITWYGVPLFLRLTEKVQQVFS